MPTARVDIILYIADRNDSRQISLLMNTCCEFFSWPKFLMRNEIRDSDEKSAGCGILVVKEWECGIRTPLPDPARSRKKLLMLPQAARRRKKYCGSSRRNL